ncbi:MAG: GTP-binding protein [Candidatus Electrothrix sp. AUS1_2]|nr:GTP-binding protein [Candidatus Electrothrix sp. AUS1_2]
MTNKELLKMIEEAKTNRVTMLDLSEKELTKLPPEISQLDQLQKLDLSYNQLDRLPSELGQLTNLYEINLANNQLTALPEEFRQLKWLTALNLSYNQFSTLPREICLLKHLSLLGLSDNKLTALPPEICQLMNLTWLDISSNRLIALPQEIRHLTRLDTIYLYKNPVTVPPPEIVNKGSRAIRQYFNALENEKHPLNEVKILLLGDGAAGKTSLVKQLLGQPFDEHEDTTHGISIQGWEPHCNGKQIRINIWDFGGQEIQHATHQFFLSKRSLYVLVLDGRKDERTEYWLRHVEAFGGSSPVLIVLNKIDSNPSFDVNRPFLRDKYPGIREFFRMSCKHGKGLPEFKEVLLAELAKVEMLETIWPASWFAVKHRLEDMDVPYISAEEYRGYCIEAGITEEEGRETLVEFLNDLGVAVHFREFDLQAMHVLDPLWVTEAVYKIITAENMVDNKGTLHLNALREILRELPIPLTERALAMIGRAARKRHCFPPETHRFIMGLMEKFELCYKLDWYTVLIPQLLPVLEPDFSFVYDESLRFALHYPDFLPPSVFPRFMVRVHKDIHANTCWRTGVLLKDKQSGAQALVKADVEARRINLWVQAERPREYLHYLRYLLADINSSFEKVTVSEQVPMPDAPYVSADYENLLDLAEAGVDIFIPIGSKKRYSVHELLGLVQPKDKAELERVAEKASPQDTITWTELITELFGPNLTVPFIGINLNLKGFFAKLLERQKQQRKQSR